MKSSSLPLYGGVAAAVLIAAASGFGLATVSQKTPVAPTAEAHAEAEGHADQVVLKPEAIQSAGIHTETVAGGGLSAEILAQGSVTASPGGQAVLTARAGGAVTRIFKRLGDPVGAGETLAIVESGDAAQIAADRTTAAAKATLAQKTLAREKSLYDQRVSPRQDYEQAQAEAAMANAEARRAQVAAGAARVTADGRGVRVTSPIAGRVTAAPASLGAFVEPQTELFRVADPRQVQIEAFVTGTDAQRIAPGDRAVLELGDGRALDVVVRAITPGLNAETRAATVVLTLPDGASLQPGQTLRVRILPARAGLGGGVVVPEEAVQTLDGKPVVFVRTAGGFKAQTVQVGARGAGRVEITGGLTAGQSVATRNAFLLKAELGKGEGEAH
ncbi:RND family efflux transporter, MFP subunit [Caulobacter sp. AP07]|uniref:efflux RND transporter periplasmic adaptor subunit n=1 Tax=Caulobacter sp. AP07 TaxID=1144304 RepID=UPI0002722524|nr:efflux RND transporter periplasmic adaptor subunit [Caulobacter sp. AP07]EJL33290.1 RND family efflux transporter, MFP subunit [Caulobacter sp. AP07]